MPTTFNTVIAEIANAFERAARRARDKGGHETTYYRIKEYAPAWLQDTAFMRAMHDAVDGRMPDDWIYEHTMRIARELENREGDPAALRDDGTDCEIADGLVDVYTSELTAWLASSIGNVELCDEAVKEGLCADDADLIDRIRVGQFIALSRIIDAVILAADAQATERDSASDESAVTLC